MSYDESLPVITLKNISYFCFWSDYDFLNLNWYQTFYAEGMVRVHSKNTETWKTWLSDTSQSLKASLANKQCQLTRTMKS